MPYLGRLMSDADDQPNSPPVVVLSYQGWQSDFGGESFDCGIGNFNSGASLHGDRNRSAGYFGDRVYGHAARFSGLPLQTRLWWMVTISRSCTIRIHIGSIRLAG